MSALASHIDVDDGVELLLREFITPRLAGNQVVYPLDEISERVFDALLRHRARMCAEREECEHIIQQSREVHE